MYLFFFCSAVVALGVSVKPPVLPFMCFFFSLEGLRIVVLVRWVVPAERQGNVQLVMSCGLIIYINSVLSVWRFSDYWSGLNSL